MVTGETAFKWTRHAAGNWTANGYEIKRDKNTSRWRILRDGVYWDSLSKLPEAKGACVRDWLTRTRANRGGGSDE